MELHRRGDRWIEKPPTKCPQGHRLGPSVGRQPGLLARATPPSLLIGEQDDTGTLTRGFTHPS